MMGFICCVLFPLMFGRFAVYSLVNTEWYWWFSISTLELLRLRRTPSLLRSGEIPTVSCLLFLYKTIETFRVLSQILIDCVIEVVMGSILFTFSFQVSIVIPVLLGFAGLGFPISTSFPTA